MMAPSLPGCQHPAGFWQSRRRGFDPASPARRLASVPTRRIFEVTLVEIALAKPAFGVVRVWAHKTLGTAQPGSLLYGIAEVLAVIM
jgi:hypothetical protein